MRTFTLHLHDARRHEQVDGVVDFIGRDATGSFGIRAGHERFLTALLFGLARFRAADAPWEHLALPGGLLYMRDGALVLCARRYFRDTDYRRIGETLALELRQEEEGLRDMRARLRQMEDEMLKRLWRLTHE